MLVYAFAGALAAVCITCAALAICPYCIKLAFPEEWEDVSRADAAGPEPAHADRDR